MAEELTVRVVRAFYYKGAPLAVGTVHALPRVFAREMIAAHKAAVVAVVEAGPQQAEAPKKPEKQDKPEKEAKHAR